MACEEATFETLRALRRLVSGKVAANSRRWWSNSRMALNNVLTIAYFNRLVCLGSRGLNFSNRPAQTRMPGGVGGDRSAMLVAPIPIGAP